MSSKQGFHTLSQASESFQSIEDTFGTSPVALKASAAHGVQSPSEQTIQNRLGMLEITTETWLAYNAYMFFPTQQKPTILTMPSFERAVPARTR